MFYVPYKSPYLDSTGISVFISFDADVKKKKAFPDMSLPLGIGVDNVKRHDIPIFIGIGRLVL